MSLLIAQNQQPPANPFGNGGFQPTSQKFQVNLSDPTLANESALSNLERLVSQLIGIFTVAGSLFFILYFILGAFKWISAQGDSGKIQKARDQIIQGATGLILIIAAYSVMGIIGSVLGIDILQPANQLRSIVNGN